MLDLETQLTGMRQACPQRKWAELEDGEYTMEISGQRASLSFTKADGMLNDSTVTALKRKKKALKSLFPDTSIHRTPVGRGHRGG